MSIEFPGDDKRCDWCDKLGVPYEYKGLTFSGLCSTDEGKLCPGCRDTYCDNRNDERAADYYGLTVDNLRKHGRPITPRLPR
ncbi:hypothetical protein [Nocardia jiangxiensis]|uniref:hypothetical protein n=1 Tax=Nocardia jiangxiensis TaxID=282685 RepID=UPI00030AC886|nr:hypothetical protein [Nocardia jiangxiensis]